MEKNKKPIRLILIVYIIFISLTHTSYSQSCTTPVSDDFNWGGIEVNSLGPPFNAVISSMAANGDICIAGIFNSAIKVARWDGTEWTLLGEKLYLNITGSLALTAIDIASNGDVYVGGIFSHALNSLTSAPIATNNIARWDNAAGEWTKVGQGANNAVWEIKIDNNDLVYVSTESVNNPNGTPVQINYAGRWNPSNNQWEKLGDGLSWNAQKITFDSNQNPYFTGQFLEAFNTGGGIVTVNKIAKWDGAQWFTLGQGLTTGFIYASSGFEFAPNGNLFLAADGVSGINSNGTPVNGPVLFWDGSQWNNIPFNGIPLTGTAGVGPSSVIDATSKFYISYFTDSTYISRKISSWDGSLWNDIAEFSGGDYVATLAANQFFPGTRLYAGGSYTKIIPAGGGSALPIHFNANWDGTIWNEMIGAGGSTGGTVRAIEVQKVSQEVLYVGGSFAEVSNVPVNNIATFDGNSWGTLAKGIQGEVYDIEDNFDPFVNILVVGGDFAYAFDDDSSVVIVNNVAIWNGQWTPLGQGVNGIVTAVLPKISYFNGTYYGGIVVAGNFTEAKNTNGTTVQVNSIAWWNWETEQWSKIGDGVTGNSKLIRSITEGSSRFYPVSEPNFYIGGDFTGGINTDQAIVNSSNILYWNNDTDEWNAVGQGVDDQVHVVTYADPTSYNQPIQNVFVYVGGEFLNSINTSGNSIETKHISVWDEFTQQWFPIGGGVDNTVYAISPDGIAGGDFLTGYLGSTASVALNHIGKFSITGSPIWSKLGMNAVNDVVRAIESVDLCRKAGENLYVGGDFSHAGYLPTNLLARWYFGYVPCYTGVNLTTTGSGSSGTGGSIGAIISGPTCSELMTSFSSVDDIVIDSLEFGETVILDSLWIQQFFDLSIFPGGDPGNPLISFDSLFIPNDFPGTLIFTGVDDTTLFAPNPESKSIGINAMLMNYNYNDLTQGNVELIFANAVTDAPSVDLYVQGGSQLASAVPFGEFAEQISLTPGIYTLDVKRNDNGQLLDSYSIDISSNADQFDLLLLSGFVDPSSNQNGPAMSLDVYNTGLSTILVGVDEEEYRTEAPEVFTLMQNYPNPFNPSTKIRFTVDETQQTELSVYNILGERVATLFNDLAFKGKFYEVDFNAERFASGIYLGVLQSKSKRGTIKMLLIK